MFYRIFILLMLSISAFAEETVESTWTSQISANYSKSSGSNNVETSKFFLETKNQRTEWDHIFKAEAIGEKSADIRKVERYLGSEKSAWKFSAKDNLFVFNQIEADKKSIYDYQAVSTLGYGRQLLKSDTLDWIANIGVGNRHSSFVDETASTNRFITYADIKGLWKFSEQASWILRASLEGNSVQNVIRTSNRLAIDLRKGLALHIDYDTKRDTGPSKIDDALTMIGLDYNF